MTAPAPASAAPPGTTETTAMDYFVPPLVIPVALLAAVLLFALIHGPIA